jgi:hypothetical protein
MPDNNGNAIVLKLIVPNWDGRAHIVRKWAVEIMLQVCRRGAIVSSTPTPASFIACIQALGTKYSFDTVATQSKARCRRLFSRRRLESSARPNIHNRSGYWLSTIGCKRQLGPCHDQHYIVAKCYSRTNCATTAAPKVLSNPTLRFDKLSKDRRT